MPVASAAAYPQHPNNCNDRTLDWYFSSSSLWTTTKKSQVRAAIKTLDDELSYNGTKLITQQEGGGVGVKVKIKDEPDTSMWGSAECNGNPSFWVNSNYSAASFYYHVGRHEMFHLAGAEHAGKNDSRNGDNPTTMATCISPSTFRTTNSITQDDAAYMNWLHNTLSNRQLHANIGFERGTTYWGKSNGTWSYQTSGGATGPGHVAFFASGSAYSSYIYQTVRLWTGDDNESVRAKINAKKPLSSYTTQARAALYKRTLTEGSTANSCHYPDGLDNLNSISITTGYVLEIRSSMTTLGSTSWTAVTSNWDNPPTNDGYQYQIRAYGKSTTSSGGTGSVRFDNVRGEGT